MLKALLDRFAIRPFERAFSYDASYMRALLAARPASFLKFSVLSGMVERRDAPAEALAAAGVVATLREDCGPCTQIGVDMAAKAGVPAAVLKAILVGDEAAMGETAALGYRFARAALRRDMIAADPARDEIVSRWGKAALVDISLAITTARLYPTVKYALGHGRACSRITVAGETTAVRRAPEPLAA